jgi:hypothetical protein
MILARLAALQHSGDHLSYRHHEINFFLNISYEFSRLAAIRAAHIRHSAHGAEPSVVNRGLFAGLHE